VALALALSQPNGRPAVVMTEPNMDLLARRIAEVRRGVPACRLVVLESMVPGQELRMTAPPALVQLLESGSAASPIVVLGRSGERPHSHGVSVKLESVTLVPVSPVHPEGTADIVLRATRLVEVVEVMPHHGSPWLGRPARARWIDTLDESVEPPEASLLERSEALEEKVGLWLELVRQAGWSGALERILSNLGSMPAVEEPSMRALWVAGLLNPMPTLDIAYEVRGATLMAPNAHLRLKAVENAIADSIKRLMKHVGCD